MSNRITRRRFIASTSAATALTLLPGVTRNVLGANEKLNIACIGVGGRGGDDMNGVAHEAIVALCDIDEKTLGHAARSRDKAQTFRDYRVMFDKAHKTFDAVTIGTPDHHHAPPIMLALAHDKHVYCEKPLTHTVREAQLVAAAVAKKNGAKTKLATQMGTQIHAGGNYRRVVELIQAGVLGDVTEVHTWVGTSYHGGDRPDGEAPVPPNVDWDLWLGPAPHRPYVPKVYHPFAWRGWWDFGGGALSDMACHHMDLPCWALGLRFPTSVTTTGPTPHAEAPPAWLIAEYQFPVRSEKDAGHFGFLGQTSRSKGGPPVKLTWYHGGKKPKLIEDGKLPNWGGGNLFIGTEGMMLADYGRHILFRDGKEVGEFDRPKPWIPNSAGHHVEWTQACKSGRDTTCSFDYATTLTLTVNLGNAAHRCGQTLEWDAKQGKVTNTRDADQYLDKTYRKGWELVKV